MKLLMGLGLIGCGMLTGCATGNVEDDAFFNRGWLWPRSIDQREKPPLSEDSTQPIDR